MLGSKAINYSPDHAEQVALVFALYREVSARARLLGMHFSPLFYLREREYSIGPPLILGRQSILAASTLQNG